MSNTLQVRFSGAKSACSPITMSSDGRMRCSRGCARRYRRTPKISCTVSECEDLGGVAIGGQSPLPQHRDMGGEGLDQGQLVQGGHHRDPQPHGRGQQRALGGGVEMVRRLVQQQQARRLADGAGELGSLALAARELFQPCRGIRSQAHLVQRVVDPVVDFGGGQQSAMGQCAQGDIVVQQQPSVGIVVLADIGDPTGPLGAGERRMGSALAARSSRPRAPSDPPTTGSACSCLRRSDQRRRGSRPGADAA